MLGVPEVVEHLPGIDSLGSEARIAPSVSVLRYGADTPAITLGNNCSLYDGVRLVIGNPAQHPDCGIRIGHRVIVNVGAYLSGEGGLTLEDDVLIGPGAFLLSAGHQIHGGHPCINHNPLTYGPIRVGQGAWIGAGAFVLQGVTIGQGAVIGAGSVVTRDIPPFAVAVGNPARIVHTRQGFSKSRHTHRWMNLFSRWRQP
jgi:galactoside O-acetyltransferase